MLNALPPTLSDTQTTGLEQRQRASAQLVDEMLRFGYQPVDTPLVEYADLFLTKAGDAAINRLVSFELGSRTLCLRPEFTAPAARLYGTHQTQGKTTGGPLRFQFSGPILQFTDLKHGEITQQYAIGAELINAEGTMADAEIIGLAAQLLRAMGLDDWSLRIGHSGLINQFLAQYALNRQMHRFVLHWLPELQSTPGKLDEAIAALEMAQRTSESQLYPDTTLDALQVFASMPGQTSNGSRSREEIIARLLEKQQYAGQIERAKQTLRDSAALLSHAKNLQDLAAYLSNTPLENDASQLLETLDLLTAYGIPRDRIVLDLSFTRNLDYYTGIVFEFQPVHAASTLLCGGGRYDELIGLLNGSSSRTPAVGFMLYLDSLLSLIHPEQRARIPVIYLHSTHEPPTAVLKIAQQMRSLGLSVVTGSTPTVIPETCTHMAALTHNDQLQVRAIATDQRIQLPLAELEQLCEFLEKTS